MSASQTDSAGREKQRNTHTVGWAVMAAVMSRGVDTIFGIPGTHNLELYRAIDELGFRAVTTRHEQGAGFAADGWSQLSGRPGVVIPTSGPGLLNVTGAAASAFCESRPMLIISPGAPRAAVAGRGELHEMKDAVGALDRIVAWSRRAHDGAEAVGLIHRAFDEFALKRPRPVHIEIPLDVLEGPHTPSSDECGEPDPLVVDTPSAASIEDAAALLTASRRPVLLLGAGAIPAAEGLVELAERLSAPVVTTVNGKGIVPETHPLSLGSQLRFEPARRLCAEADVLLIVGSKVGRAELWDEDLIPVGKVIRIDIDAEQLRLSPRSDLPITGDARVVIPLLLSRLTDQPRRESRDINALRNTISVLTREADPTSVDLSAAILAALPDDVIVAGDSSQITYLGMASTLLAVVPRQLLSTPTFATLGYGLPAAIGASIAQPERVVACVIGDGALMFALQELATAVAEGVRIIVVCVDNGGYGEIKQNMRDRNMRSIAVDLDQPDWVALARSLGIHAVAAEPTVVSETLASMLGRPGVSFVHLRV